MNKNGYLFVYFIVFLFSFFGLLDGMTNNWIVDSLLNFIFFIVSYSFILILYETDRKKNIYFSILISVMTLIYFYNLNVLLLTIPIVLMLYLFLVKSKDFVFNSFKSLFHNFYSNIFFIEKTLLLLFFLSIFIINYIKTH